MEYRTKLKWSFISVIIASVCWMIDDIAIAGFEIIPAKHPSFSEIYADQMNVEFAALMLPGSTQRLMLGALIPAMTAILFLPGVWLAHPYLLKTANGFMQTIYISWGTAIIVLLLGWFLFSVFIFLRKTGFSKWVGLISPVLLTIYQVPIKYILPASTLRTG